MATLFDAGFSGTRTGESNAETTETIQGNEPVVWALGYEAKLIKEKGVKWDEQPMEKEDTTVQKNARSNKAKKAQAPAANLKDSNNDAVGDPDFEPDQKEKPDAAERDAYADDDDDDIAAAGKGKKSEGNTTTRTAKPRVRPSQHLTWLVVPIHGQRTIKILEKREPLDEDDAEFGPFRQPPYFKPNRKTDFFVCDRHLLGQLGMPYGQDLFRGRPNDVRAGARDATPIWFSRLQNLIFVCSDAGSMYRHAAAIVNLAYPPICNISPPDAFGQYKHLPRRIAFMSSPFACDHEDCAILRKEFADKMRVIGSKKLEGCPWWAFSDCCFRYKSICIKDFPHPRDVLFEKGIPLKEADSVASWALSVFNHVAVLPDLREPNEPSPEHWGKRQTPAAANQWRYIGIKDGESRGTLAKLVVRQGCNTAAVYDQEGQPDRFKDMIINEKPCPSCKVDFFSGDSRGGFRLSTSHFLPRAGNNKISFLHYGCDGDHDETCEKHNGCADGRDEALKNVHNGKINVNMQSGTKPARKPTKRKANIPKRTEQEAEDVSGVIDAEEEDDETGKPRARKRAKRAPRAQEAPEASNNAAETPVSRPIHSRNQETTGNGHNQVAGGPSAAGDPYINSYMNNPEAADSMIPTNNTTGGNDSVDAANDAGISGTGMDGALRSPGFSISTLSITEHEPQVNHAPATTNTATYHQESNHTAFSGGLTINNTANNSRFVDPQLSGNIDPALQNMPMVPRTNPPGQFHQHSPDPVNYMNDPRVYNSGPAAPSVPTYGGQHQMYWPAHGQNPHPPTGPMYQSVMHRSQNGSYPMMPNNAGQMVNQQGSWYNGNVTTFPVAHNINAHPPAPHGNAMASQWPTGISHAPGMTHGGYPMGGTPVMQPQQLQYDQLWRQHSQLQQQHAETLQRLQALEGRPIPRAPDDPVPSRERDVYEEMTPLPEPSAAVDVPPSRRSSITTTTSMGADHTDVDGGDQTLPGPASAEEEKVGEGEDEPVVNAGAERKEDGGAEKSPIPDYISFRPEELYG
ncbi:hypothetical protein F4775DRAFT_606953 [Biscogniauxia sp. FL1348]|nr:hypothetical protein F4775DRAFT_606953 [Biscogniauxia sp. FL1348]